MRRIKNTGLILCGFVLGASLSPTVAQAAETLTATLSTHRIFVDGQETRMTAYSINGNNYVKLRDVGEAVGFEVYWDGENDCVQVVSGEPYTGVTPAKEAEAISSHVKQIKPSEEQTEHTLKQDIVDRANAIRTERGVAELTVDAQLMAAAQVRAEEMAATGVYSHTRPDGSGYATVTDCRYVGENIHRLEDWALADRDLAETVVWAWSVSEGHLKNMTNSRYGSVGIGLARGLDETGEGCWYCVQLLMDKERTIGWVDEPITK